MGDKPFFESITLEKGVEYTAQIVTPTDKPAAEVPYHFVNWSWGKNPPGHFMDVYEGQTDSDGRIRFRSTKSQALALYVKPPEPARRDSHMRRTNTSGGQTGPASIRISGYRPTWAASCCRAASGSRDDWSIPREGRSPGKRSRLTRWWRERRARPRLRPMAASSSGRSAPRTTSFMARVRMGSAACFRMLLHSCSRFESSSRSRSISRRASSPRRWCWRGTHGSGGSPVRRFSGSTRGRRPGPRVGPHRRPDPTALEPQ